MSEMNVIIPPGLIGLRNKETGNVVAHFPVDVREILSTEKGKFEIVDNGAAEAARMSPAPLREMQDASDSLGIDGKIMVPMTAEEQIKYREFLAASSKEPAKPVTVEKAGADKVAPAK